MLNSILLALVSAAFAIGGASNLTNVNQVKEARDTKIIVELDNNADVLSSQRALLEEIATKVTTNFKVTNRLTSVANAIMMEVPSAYVDQIRNLTLVNKVNYDSLIEAKYFDGATQEIALSGKARLAKAHTDADNASAETMNKPAGTKEGEGVLVAVLDSSFLLKDGQIHECFVDLPESTSVKLSAEQAKAIVTSEGFHGKPDATHSTYFNRKVPYFYDYGGATSVKSSAGPVDYDVYSAMSDHGTHVASLIGANGANFQGIAPKVQLALMKVFTEYTPTAADAKEGYTASIGAYDSAILLALDDASKLGADIVNMSLGSDLDDFSDHSIVQTTIQRLKSEGISVNIAGGNSGKGMYDRSGYEHWSTDVVETGILSDYANNSGATTVAAAQANWQFYDECLLVANNNVSFKDQVENHTSTDGEVTFKPERHLTDLIISGKTEFNWYKIPNWGEAKDYTKAKFKSGSIAVVDRGETTFTAKVEAAQEAGAVAILIINNDASETDFTFRMDFAGFQPKIPVATVLYRDKPIFDDAGSGVLNILKEVYADNPTAYQFASFTSDGPTYDLKIKPEISSPGQNIRGAVIADSEGKISFNSYEEMSGTSMATPNYCGAEAILLSEHLGDQTYKQKIAARTMSTAKLMYDDLGVNHTSVRIQGAGMVDISNALNSQVYLEGVDNDGNGIDKAKIELKNNDDIKNGTVKLKFLAHNESAQAITYTAKTYIYRPLLEKYDTSIDSLKGLDGEFASIKDQLITTVSQTVTVNPGDSVIELNPYTLTAEQKNQIDKAFQYGCVIEGFVTLETSSKDNHLNIPFLGFYGDYNAASPVEPFNFEKDPNKVYQSGLLNNVSKALGFDSADFSSGWVQGYFRDFDDISMEDVHLNKTNIYKMQDNNRKTLTSVGYNPYTGEIDPNNIYVGNNGTANTMIIQQCVLRSVSTNVMTLKNKATGETILVDHMFDSLYGDSEEENYALFKSHASGDLLDSGIIAHRAYSIVPTYDRDTKEMYPDGEYELKFNYTMAAGGTYTMTYTIHIDSKTPTIKSVDEVKKGGKMYVRIRYNETNLSYGTINGNQVPVEFDEQGAYVDISKSEFKSEKKLFVKANNLAFASSASLTHLDDPYHITVTSSELLSTHDFTATIKDNNSGSKASKDFTLAFKKGSKKVTLKEAFVVSIKLTEGLGAQDLAIKVDGKALDASQYSVDGYYLSFTTTSTTFTISSALVENPPAYISVSGGSSQGGNKGCGGAIVTTSIVVSTFAFAGLALLLIKRKKHSFDR